MKDKDGDGSHSDDVISEGDDARLILMKIMMEMLRMVMGGADTDGDDNNDS